jgi:hypothetical protein
VILLGVITTLSIFSIMPFNGAAKSSAPDFPCFERHGQVFITLALGRARGRDPEQSGDLQMDPRALIHPDRGADCAWPTKQIRSWWPILAVCIPGWC